ncbi:MAG: hypothetical protein Q4G35_04305 [Propionibacteriaceae bacterium]|nr:hypothetical protein [Propionibacteriaceae bacterium]
MTDAATPGRRRVLARVGLIALAFISGVLSVVPLAVFSSLIAHYWRIATGQRSDVAEGSFGPWVIFMAALWLLFAQIPLLVGVVGFGPRTGWSRRQQVIVALSMIPLVFLTWYVLNSLGSFPPA